MTRSRHVPSVAIIIVNWNRRADTLACLASLRQLTYPNVTIMLVDNGSTDGTADAVREAFPQITVIELEDNLGFAAGNNIALSRAIAQGMDYALLLNNDTEVEPRLLDALIDAAEQDPRVGIVGPKIYYYDTPTILWSAGGTIDWLRGTTAMRGLNSQDTGEFDQIQEVDFVTGCALLVRCSMLETVGLLDERFGMYFEETEWCVRAARQGRRIIYTPHGHVYHKVQPTDRDTAPYVVYYMARNRLLFLRLTHASWRAWLDALVLQDLRLWCVWRVLPRWRGHGAQRVALRYAWRDFLFKRFGMATTNLSSS